MTENNGQMQELPMGWAWANIDDLVSTDGLFCDGDWIETKDQDPNGNVRLIQLADIGDGFFKNKSNRHLTFEKSIELGCTYLLKDDLLIARLPDPLGRACMFPLEGDEKYVTAVDICIMRPNSENLSIRFLLYLINSPQIRTEIDKFKSGSTRKRISRTNLAKIGLSIAPPPEQHHIVERIEELFSELDNGIESLKKAREQLKTYRQAVLKYAFEGKLTQEWRTQHLPAGRQGQAGTPPEPAENLLERIRKEREKHYQKQLEDWKKTCELSEADGKKKPAKPKKPDFYSALTKKEILDLPLLPDLWCWEKIGNLCQSIVPNRDKPKTFTGNIPWLTTPDLDLQKITVNLNLINKRLSKKEINKYNAKLIPENSVIMTCVGTFGVTCINNQECVINQQLHAFITHQFINSRYIAYALKFKEKHMEQNSTSTTISYLNKTKCNSVPMPICAIDEQKAIVEKIESRLSVCDQLEQTIEDSLNKAEALRQSILKKAFTGELTREWRLPAGRQGKNGDVYIVENRSGKLMPKRKEAYFVYVLECEDGSIYKGVTSDLNKRINDHLAGIGAEWTKTHRPIALIHYEEFKSEKEAVEREKYLKSGVGREWLKELQKEKAEQYLSAEKLLERIKAEKARLSGNGKNQRPRITKKK